jgi:hypothetical protein
MSAIEYHPPEPTKLDEATFLRMKQALTKEGHDNPPEYLYEALHDGAVVAVEVAARDEAIDAYDDVDDDQREELLLAYKNGFWSSINEHEIKDLTKRNEELAKRNNEVTDAMTALVASGVDHRFPGMRAPRIALMSSKHISPADKERLTATFPLAPTLPDMSEFLVMLPIGGGRWDVESEFRLFSIPFRDLLIHLAESGYGHVTFSELVPPIEFFPVFDEA